MAQESAAGPWSCHKTPSPSDGGRQSHDHHATNDGEEWHRQRLQCRDDGARALRAVFSSHDNWLDLSEAERDEWRGYFEQMLEWLHRLGYTSECNPCSRLLESLTTDRNPSDEGAA